MHTYQSTLRLAGVVSLVALLAGCAGARVDPAPLAEEVARLREEARAMAADSVSLGYLTVADTLFARAETAEAASPAVAISLFEESRAAAATAVAASVAARRAAEADECAQAVDSARQDWQDALRTLDQTEKAAERTAKGVTRADGDLGDLLVIPQQRIASPEAHPTAEGVRSEAATWKGLAKMVDAPSADQENVWTRALAAAANPKLAPAEADRHLRRAGWAVTELAWRVSAEMWSSRCGWALGRAQTYAHYRDQALWAMADLERSMKDSARRQLDEERARLEDRQEQLYNSLKQFEGKFASIRRDARGTIMSLADILFDFDKAVLRREAELNLAKVAVILDQFPEMHIFVEGHTDNVGKEDYNQKLSERRAVAVRDFLQSQGVDAARMETQGYGMSQPVAPNDTEEGRQKNRRVDLVIREE